MTITATCPCGADLTVEDAALTDALKAVRDFSAQHPCDSKRARERLEYFGAAVTPSRP